MGHMRAMFIGYGPSGLPADVAVNTFHFWDGTAEVDANALANCAAAVAAFYTEVVAVRGAPSDPQTRTIGEYLSPWIQRDAEIRVYNMADPKPRVPLILPFTMGGTVGPNGLPEEVAVCLSYNGEPPNTPRRRGRIYIGPLSLAVYGNSTATANSAPSPAFCRDLAIAGQRLSNQGPAISHDWSIFSSKPTPNFVKIVHGYVDNAFDTQIRRGPESTARKLWDQTAIVQP